MKKKSTLFLSLLCAAALFASACAQDNEAAGVTVQPVSVVASVSGADSNRFSGKAVSPHTQKINRAENRTVKEVLVNVGDEVKAGDVLFRYDADEAKLNIDQAKLEVERSKNSIETLKRQIETLEKEKNKAKSSEQLEYTLQIQSLEVEIKQTEYNISAKEVEIERLEAASQNIDVVSEIDGVVKSISENGMDMYGNPQAYITIIEVGSYRIEGKIAETNINSIYIGEPVLIRSRTDENQTWTGIIEEIDTENNSEDGQQPYYYYDGGSNQSASKYPFYITLDDSTGLMMGQHVYIEPGTANPRAEGIWLYQQFVHMEGEKAFVWVADENDKIQKREITIDETDEQTGELHVASGLSVSDYIASDSSEIKEGVPAVRFDEGDFGGPNMTIPEMEIAPGNFVETNPAGAVPAG